MATRQKQRADETKQAILAAAGTLFAHKGYESVTMREIAKEAACSHTTIYIYFKDKEELLHALSMPALIAMQERFSQLLAQKDVPARTKLNQISMDYLHFCLRNKTMYTVFFIAKATNVEETSPELEINRVRIELFRQLGQILGELLQLEPADPRLLACNRIYFYMLHGIVSTYAASDEPLAQLFKRLEFTFAEAFESLIAGFVHRTGR